MKKLCRSLFYLSLLFLFAKTIPLAGCGGGFAPPASIPAPVSSLMVASAPDSTGAVTINGNPGAIPTPVEAGATVQAQNCTQGVCSLFRKFFLRSAWAQTFFAEVPVQPDGSFTNLRVDVVQPTDPIGIRQSTPSGDSNFIQIHASCGGANPPC